MRTYTVLLAIVLLQLAPARIAIAQQTIAGDWRNFSRGWLIPDENYCDQPYVVKTKDGAWLCVMTTGKGREGSVGQHIVATRSTDHGRTWSPLIDIEPADGPEASWATPLVTPSGRIYVFYTYNKQNLRDNGAVSGSRKRVDTQGAFAYKYSDDGGRTWSARRYYIPMRNLFFDYKNPLGPDVHLFWSICKPVVDRGEVFIAGSKIAYFGYGFLAEDRGVLFRSSNLLTEPDPTKHKWEMLPPDDQGLGTIKGPICEEHNLVALSDGTLYMIARTVEGYPVHYYSHDRGKTWSDPEYATYVPGGRKIRNPRACPRIWKTSDGRFLLWFHNNGHQWYASGEATASRNVAWLSGGIERNGRIWWTQPEVVRYCDNLYQGCSYPDLIEDEGRFYISCTQKTEARVGEIPREWLEKLWKQFEIREVTAKGLVLDLSEASLRQGTQLKMPQLPNLAQGGGFSVGLWLQLAYAEPGQTILDSTNSTGAGIRITTAWPYKLAITTSDGRHTFTWDTDPWLVGPDKPHHVMFIVDGGPKLLSVVVDGQLCDGGESDVRKYGYGRFHQSEFVSREKVIPKEEIGDVTGGPGLRILPRVLPHTRLLGLRIYNRPLMTTEAIGNWRAGISGR